MTDHATPPRMPGWVKWPAITIGVLVVLFLALRLLGFEHGPGLHNPGPAATPSGGHTPGGGHG